MLKVGARAEAHVIGRDTLEEPRPWLGDRHSTHLPSRHRVMAESNFALLKTLRLHMLLGRYCSLLLKPFSSMDCTISFTCTSTEMKGPKSFSASEAS